MPTSFLGVSEAGTLLLQIEFRPTIHEQQPAMRGRIFFRLAGGFQRNETFKSQF